MQNTEKNNVVSLFDAKKKAAEAHADDVKSESDMTFEEIAARNKRNADRLSRERNTANKSVLRSYRIKH